MPERRLSTHGDNHWDDIERVAEALATGRILSAADVSQILQPRPLVAILS